MPDNWEIAEGRAVKVQMEWAPYVSLNKRGEIAMNDAAWGAIGRPWNVTLLYRPPTTPASGHPSSGRRGAIGIKFPVFEDSGYEFEPFPVRMYGRGRRMRIVRAMRMLKQYRIEVTETLQFVDPEIEKYDGEKMIVLELANSE
jgi:hypothetical protein